MAEPDAANHNRSAMTDPPAPPPPPVGANNELGITSSIQPRAPSKSPQSYPAPPTEASSKAAPLDSQPMTTSSSSSSLPSDQQAVQSMDSTGVSPYGTRSRNRTGNPRPYYGEDVHEDYEEMPVKRSQAASGPTVPSGLHSGDGEKLSGISTRRSSTTAGSGSTLNSKTAISAAQRDNLPGMSTFSVNPATSTAPQAPSRKRKAPGHGPMVSNTSSIVNQATAASIPRKGATTTASSAPMANNLMTFENCQGYLKNGKLKADDGTILGVDGVLDPSNFDFIQTPLPPCPSLFATSSDCLADEFRSSYR